MSEKPGAVHLQNLLETDTGAGQGSLFASLQADEDESRPEIASLIPEAVFDALPSRYQRAVQQAAMLYRFLENKEGVNYAAVFTGLLGSIDEAAKGLITRRLAGRVPADAPSQKDWFEPYFPSTMEARRRADYETLARNLKKTLVFQSGYSPIGLLRSCFDYALNDHSRLSGVFEAMREQFRFAGARRILAAATRINKFRNTWIAHQEQELTDGSLARQELLAWVEALRMVSET